MITLECQTCHKIFHPRNYNRKQKYCCRACVPKNKKEKKYKCTCEVCGKEFLGTRRNQRFCSKKCQVSVYKYPKHEYTRICTCCGKKFKTDKEGTRCCSPECRKKQLGHRKGKAIHGFCLHCGKELPSKKKDYCSGECRNADMKSESYKHNEDRYISTKVTSFGRKVRQHRAVMERVLGRKLRPDEHVHHKDGSKTNNSPENLEVLSASEHEKLHNKKGITKNYNNRNVLVDNEYIVSYHDLDKYQKKHVVHGDKTHKFHGRLYKSTLNSDDIV